ncbi:MAG: hypothetical protein MR033_05710, partial [Clostridiales bacterium]|nr:hypothetical protein [Clostridiales bacterium]
AMQKHSKKQDAPFSRPFGATENDAQKLHALWLLPMIVVRNTAHEVLCPACGKTAVTPFALPCRLFCAFLLS